MSLKPIKKSDANKTWMAKRQDRGIRIQPEYHLIVTEGTETEPQYFQSVKNAINSQYRGRIKLEIHGEGDNTLGLFEKAKEQALQSPVTFSHVWVVYDTDDFPADHINRTDELCRTNSNDETQFHAIWSNQCVELWYLLHFGYFHSDIHRNEYWPKLTAELSKIGAGEYSKSRPDIYDILRPYMNNALRNASRLDEENNGKTPANSAPGTKVHELMKILKPYLE